MGDRIGRTFIQAHHDITVQAGLDGHSAFRFQAMAGTIDMGLKGNAIFIHFAELGQGKNLETAAVCEDWATPATELVQPAERLHDSVARAQCQMIGVAQDHGGARRFQLSDLHTLDRAQRSDRHKSGSRHLTMRRTERTASSGRFGIALQKPIFEHD